MIDSGVECGRFVRAFLFTCVCVECGLNSGFWSLFIGGLLGNAGSLLHGYYREI
jgi:hypothetical protein